MQEQLWRRRDRRRAPDAKSMAGDATFGSDMDLPDSDLALSWIELPLRTELFGVCQGGIAELWVTARQLVRSKAHWPLSPLGRQRLRPSPGAKTG